MDKKTALIEWGLNEKEAKVYLYTLERGPVQAQEISKSTGILRQTVYEILNKLESLGLISEVRENKKTNYTAINPNNLILKLEEKKKIINSVLPDLKELMNMKKSESNAQLYRGIKGIKSINEEILKSKEVLTILPIIGEEIMKEFYIGNFSKKRIEKKIPIKIIRGEIKTEIQRKIKTDKNVFREVKIFNELKEIQVQYILFDNALAIISFHNEPFGIIIKDSLVFDSMKIIFNFLWKISKRY